EHKAQSPEIALGADGSIHMIWIDENTAAPAADHSKYGHSHVAATNLLYARSSDGGKTFTPPVQINEKPGDVWGFSVSKPRIVAGANGTLHVFYPGNDVNPTNGKPEAVALYTRSTDGGRSFAKAQRLNEMGKTDASDLVHGGLTHAHVFGTLAVDGKGSVYAMWIDTRDMAKEGDSGKVFMAVSRNDGASFECDREILPADVCPCCQLTAFIDDKNRLYVGSRQVEGKFRDSVVMVSSDGGRSFSPRQRVVGSRWEIEGCPLKATSVAAAFELQLEISRRRLAIRLVGRVDAIAKRAGEALVEGHGQIAWSRTLDQVPEETGESEYGMRRVAVAVQHVGRHGVIGPEHVHGGIDEINHGAL
ncbi:MAG: exo-alpha-sialidase, partial [Gammaproteobacteria bacterium]|nr:exo-alpha-sialidase [Gammaproteobacteria bacterium]